MAGKRYKAQPSAPVEWVLGVVALVVWGVSQLVGSLRVLVATLSVAVVLGLAHTAVAPVRGVGSTWGAVTVLAPALPTAALVLA
jgi:hypothetical protein